MFSALERNFIFSTINKCKRSSTAAHLEEVLEYFLGGFIPHKMSVCGIGNMEANTHLLRLDFGWPAGLVDTMAPAFCMSNNFLLPFWRQQRAPLYASVADYDVSRLAPEQREWKRRLLEHGVGNMAMHGVIDAATGLASVFYLGALAEPLSAQQQEIFSMLAPHLHRVLLSILQAQPLAPLQSVKKPLSASAFSVESMRSATRANWGLTRREAEILKWIYYGKTNSETGLILGISELTVRNHMRNLMLKLGVGNRTQAVVKAMQNNIFSDENTPLPK